LNVDEVWRREAQRDKEAALVSQAGPLADQAVLKLDVKVQVFRTGFRCEALAEHGRWTGKLYKVPSLHVTQLAQPEHLKAQKLSKLRTASVLTRTSCPENHQPS
jgi:hypothetical protein